MLLSLYTDQQRFRKLLPDWAVAAVLTACFCLIAERARPFLRQFQLNDLTIQHLFVAQETVSGLMLLVLSATIPLLVIAIVVVRKYLLNRWHAHHMLNVSLLGLALCISVTGVLTNVLKAWVGKLRPDFLARCGPGPQISLDKFVDISVCTAPLGKDLLQDGMRSTPSGHSSVAFTAFGYLCIWLYGQWRLCALSSVEKPLYMYIVAAVPLMLAIYIALSRVQDYKHTFLDVTLGSVLGCTVAFMVHSKYFQPFYGDMSNELLDVELEPVLPL